MNTQFHQLKVSDIKIEAAQTAVLTFDIPADVQDKFQFIQGQYLTLSFEIKGNEERRAYSICSSPHENALKIGIKAVPNGKVSNHILKNVKVGDTIAVMPPQGRFYTPLSNEQRKTYYLVGAGSGITPLVSIVKAVLETEPASFVHLIYGNRNEDTIVFKDELVTLEKKYEGQLQVTHVLSQPKREKAGGLAGLFSKGKTTWTGLTGRITAGLIDTYIEKNPKRTPEAEYFVCGPTGVIDALEQYIVHKKIDVKNFHFERFTTDEAAVAAANAAAPSVAAKLIVQLNGDKFEIDLKPKEKIIDALVAAKKNPPYSCTSGACSTCTAKVVSGSAKMDVCYALDEDEIAAGMILTCQARATSEILEISYDL